MTNNYQNIPQELRELRQWILWQWKDIGAAKPTKLPIDAKTGKLAAVNDPETWCDFETAVLMAHRCSGIGFVFTENDPYAFIDLDDAGADAIKSNQQIDIFKELNSYSEISPSKKGLHVIVKASVIAGRKRDFIEIYSNLRYATFTGDVFNNAPIENRQEQVTRIWEQLGSAPTTYDTASLDKPEVQTDSQIITQAENASNGEKFKALFSGQWTDIYPSQSEADFALIDIIAFYTQNRKQIARIFRLSKLGERKKAERDVYITYMVNKSFDRMLPQVDIDGFQNAVKNKLAEQQELPFEEKKTKPNAYKHLKKDVKNLPTVADPIVMPPGLLGDVARFIYAAAPRPVPEIAIAAAIGLMSGIAGRAYNVNGEGLNQYILLIASTGSGKEAMASGIDKLINAVKLQVPTATGIIGPAEISSGEALLKHLNKNPCFVSILSEFGYRLQSWGGERASPSDKNLRRMILDLYHKSGYGRVFRPKIYSDREKNVEETVSPSFTILGEATPRSFYDYLDEAMLEDGLLPRFVIMEYRGERVDLNENCSTAYPPNWLIDSLSSFMANCETLSFNKKVINVQATAEARQMLDDFDKFCTREINTSAADTLKHLWNRAHLKVWKLSALIAAGVNPYDPIITPQYLMWAMDIIKHDIRNISDKFDSGVIGANQTEVKQGADILHVIREYLKSDFEAVEKYAKNGKSGKDKLLFDNSIVPYCYLSRRLMSMGSFRSDRMGATFAIKRTLQGLIDSDKIREIPKADLSVKFGTTQRAFMLSDIRELED